MTPNALAKLRTFLAEPLSSEVSRSLEPLLELDDIVRVALMPDAHVADGVCVGTVLATRDGLYPDAVGSDIGCGMMAVKLDADFAAVRRGNNAERLLDAFTRRIPVNKWPERQCLPDGLEIEAPSPFRSLLERDGAVQLGTLGRGNHFLELDYGEQGELWLLLHSGSRSLGPKIRSFYRQQALEAGPTLGHSAVPGMVAPSSLGQAYLRGCALAVAYAEANRQRLLELGLEVLDDILGVAELPGERVSCVHNFVKLETVGQSSCWIHRKRALSARAGELGIIPGSMGTESFLVEGRGVEAGLCSSSHGAGRVRSRGEAFRCVSVRRLEREMAGITYSRAASRALLDEAPSNYKAIAAVMRAQRELTRVRARLRPWVVYKGL